MVKTKALDIVDKLVVKTFDWKHNEEPDIGLIAEEVAEVFPEALWKDGGLVMGLKPLTLIALLIKAIQELRSKIDER